MDSFLQVLLGTVMLSQHIDEESSYYEYFSGWISRNQHKWGVLTTREYQNEVGRSEEYLLTTLDHSKKKLLLEISEKALPWLVLACHVLLGFTTDTKPISELLTFCGFVKVRDEIIQSIVEWSTYPPRLNMNEGSQEFCITAFEALQAAMAKGENTPNMGWRRMGFQKLVWKTLYQHHLSTPGLNPAHKIAGIVFYALISLGEGVYTLVFIDALTEAHHFSQVFRAHSLIAIAEPIAQALSSYMKEYGHPEYFVLVNPLRGWVHAAMTTALRMLTEPSTSQFIAPRQLSTNLKCVPDKVEDFLASVEQMLRDDTFLSDYPPFNLIKHAGPWPEVFVENLHWSQFQLNCTHPRGDVRDPQLTFAKKLKVVDLPSLETGDISEYTYDILKCKRPGSEGVENVPEYPELLDESLDAKFASLMKLSGQFSFVSGRNDVAATIDFVSRKMILHVWQCFKHRETMATNGQDRNILHDDMNHLLSHGHDVYKVINGEEEKWLFKGTELARGADGTILISIGTEEGTTDLVTWWEHGGIANNVFSRDSLVNFLPKTVEQAVEDDKRRVGSVHIDESEDEGVAAASKGKKIPPRKRRRVEESLQVEGGYHFGSASDNEREYSDMDVPFQQPRTSTGIPDHLKSVYKKINPEHGEYLYNKFHPIVKTLKKTRRFSS